LGPNPQLLLGHLGPLTPAEYAFKTQGTVKPQRAVSMLLASNIRTVLATPREGWENSAELLECSL